MLKGYDAFLRALDQYGFLPLAGRLPIVTLEKICGMDSLFDGNEECDPWHWRMRFCTDKDGAYAHILFGKPTFISPSWYHTFVSAFSCPESIARRYERGECSTATYRLWQLFERRPVWSRHELANELGRGSVPSSALSSALIALEREMYITISGEVHKVSLAGTPYGWPSAEYTRTDVFTPPQWPRCALTRAQARERIAAKALETSPALDARAIRRMLGA